MPRYKKGLIGRRPKRAGKRSQTLDPQSSLEDPATPTTHHEDHTYTVSQPVVFDDNTVRQLQWAEAWTEFYISPVECPEELRESHSPEKSKHSDNCSADEFYVLAGEMHQYNHENNLDDVVSSIHHHRRYKQYLSLKRALFEEYEQLGDFTLIRTKEDVITLVQFYDGSELALKLSVTITPSLLASISVHRQKIQQDHDFWIGLPKFLSTVTDVKKLLSKLSSFQVCLGNYEDKFSHLVPIGVGLSQASASCMAAYREGDFGVNTNGIQFSSTVRSTSCALLVLGKMRCGHCCRYRSTLRKNLSRESLSPKPCQPQPDKLSHKTHKHMTKLELLHKYKIIKTHNQSLKSELDQLRGKVYNTM